MKQTSLTTSKSPLSLESKITQWQLSGQSCGSFQGSPQPQSSRFGPYRRGLREYTVGPYRQLQERNADLNVHILSHDLF